MIVICAWCLKRMGEKEPMNITHISHGMCKDCAELMRKAYNLKELVAEITNE